LKRAVIAITGADLSAKLAGEPVPLFKSFIVEQNDVLEFGQPMIGAYAHITVHGGVDVPFQFSSRSTDVKAKLGGYQGRALQKGDQLAVGKAKGELLRCAGRGLREEFTPNYAVQTKIRIMLDPDERLFREASITKLDSEKFVIGRQANRMGYRLTGPKLTHVDRADIISDAILPGTIQVPASGEPIVLLADRQTTGGYARIATVIST